MSRHHAATGDTFFVFGVFTFVFKQLFVRFLDEYSSLRNTAVACLRKEVEQNDTMQRVHFENISGSIVR